MEPDDARAPRSARRVGAWMALIVIAAALPILAKYSLLPAFMNSAPLAVRSSHQLCCGLYGTKE